MSEPSVGRLLWFTSTARCNRMPAWLLAKRSGCGLCFGFRVTAMVTDRLHMVYWYLLSVFQLDWEKGRVQKFSAQTTQNWAHFYSWTTKILSQSSTRTKRGLGTLLWAIDENMGTNLQAFYKHFYIGCLKTQKQQLHFIKIKMIFFLIIIIILFIFKYIFVFLNSGRARVNRTGRKTVQAGRSALRNRPSWNTGHAIVLPRKRRITFNVIRYETVTAQAVSVIKLELGLGFVLHYFILNNFPLIHINVKSVRALSTAY